jgi:cobalt/nickel transport system permease protein
MSHLHIPDGVLPVLLWAPGLALALLVLVVGARALRGTSPQRLAYQGALGALMLAAMAVEVPLGPLEYHLTLAGPVGVLLGPASFFQVAFVANAILALVGHGGLTVVGLNSLVLGAGGMLARPVYEVFARRWRPPVALAATTALVQAVSGALWLAVMVTALRVQAVGPHRVQLVAGVAFPLYLAGILIESAVAVGIARFLVRVRPDLLPGSAVAQGGPA